MVVSSLEHILVVGAAVVFLSALLWDVACVASMVQRQCGDQQACISIVAETETTVVHLAWFA